MDFVTQAASFVPSNTADESSTTSDGGFDFNKMSDLMSKADDFLAVKEEVEKPSSDVTQEAPERTTTEEDSEKPELEKPPPADTVKPEEQDSPPPTAASTEEPSESSNPDAKPSYSDLYEGAQTLYSGLQDTLEGKTEVDTQQLASAAGDLLQGAESYGLLEPENLADYFKKAEELLHDYGSSDTAAQKPSSGENA